MAADAPFIIQVWDNRALDLALQIVVVITGVMGVLSLLGETRAPESPAVEARP